MRYVTFRLPTPVGPLVRVGVLTAAGTVVEEWVGDGGRVVEFGTRFTSMVVVPAEGAEVVVTGTVKALDEQTRRATVDLAVTAQGTKVLGRCLAVVQLD